MNSNTVFIKIAGINTILHYSHNHWITAAQLDEMFENKHLFMNSYFISFRFKFFLSFDV